jgi:hypothetical protein
MEDMVAEAVGKGMYLVDQSQVPELKGEYEQVMREADALCEVADPESEPYKSKYIAREKLNAFCNKLEANRTVASLESKRDVFRDLNWRIAAIQVRLASIAWDCEEPHSCQTELDLAIVSILARF